MPRCFPPPWTAEPIPGGFVVKDATGQSLAYVYARETKAQADIAKVLTMDEARREQHRQATDAATRKEMSALWLRCRLGLPNRLKFQRPRTRARHIMLAPD